MSFLSISKFSKFFSSPILKSQLPQATNNNVRQHALRSESWKQASRWNSYVVSEGIAPSVVAKEKIERIYKKRFSEDIRTLDLKDPSLAMNLLNRFNPFYKEAHHLCLDLFEVCGDGSSIDTSSISETYETSYVDKDAEYAIFEERILKACLKSSTSSYLSNNDLNDARIRDDLLDVEPATFE